MGKGEASIIRALVIGILLIPINFYWIAQSEMVLYSFPTIVVPFYNVIISLLFLIILSLPLRKLSPKFALDHRELLMIYIVLSVASSIGSTCLMQEIPEAVNHVFWFATEENEWQTLIWKHIPVWLTVNDKTALRNFYEGDSSIYRAENIMPFLVPILWWSIFLLVLLFAMWCINILLRKQWSDRERLNYPATQLPFDMLRRDSGFFKNKLMWIGFAIAASICLINGISFLYPAVPTIPVKARDISSFFTKKPWNAIGIFNISFYPFFIGLAFLMPLDLSFSCWFFYLLVYKAQLVLGGSAGWSSNSFRFGEQLFGIFIGIFVVILWKGRSYFRQILLCIPGKGSLDDSDEAMKYRSAVLGLIVCIAILMVFSARMGIALWAAGVFFAAYFLFSVVITRIRAEFGFPVHNLDSASVNSLTVSVLGSRNFNHGSLAGLAMFSFFNIEYEAHPMPIQLEALKLADRASFLNKRLTWIMVLVFAVSVTVGFWIFLGKFYKLGADSGRMSWWVFFQGWRTSGLLERWLAYPTEINYGGVTFIGVGVIFSLLLMFMRTRFLWFPFHPLGYAVAMDWSMSNLWLPALISWFTKAVVLKYGGRRLYRRVLPFFLGLILGDFVIGGLWDLLSMVIDAPTYQMWP